MLSKPSTAVVASSVIAIAALTWRDTSCQLGTRRRCKLKPAPSDPKPVASNKSADGAKRAPASRHTKTSAPRNAVATPRIGPEVGINLRGRSGLLRYHGHPPHTLHSQDPANKLIFENEKEARRRSCSTPGSSNVDGCNELPEILGLRVSVEFDGWVPPSHRQRQHLVQLQLTRSPCSKSRGNFRVLCAEQVLHVANRFLPALGAFHRGKAEDWLTLHKEARPDLRTLASRQGLPQ